MANGFPNCVPNDALSQAAYQRAAAELDPVILNHSLRVFLYAATISEKEQLPWHHADRLPLLFAAAMFHDMGSSSSCDGPQRFEVEGADAAVTFLKSHGVDDDVAHQIWVAVACHTCAGIGERISALARLIRLGPLVDFKRPDIQALLGPGYIDRVEEQFPRGEPERILSDTIVEQAVRQPTKAPPATWPGVLLRFRQDNPEYQGVNKEF